MSQIIIIKLRRKQCPRKPGSVLMSAIYLIRESPHGFSILPSIASVTFPA